MASVLFLMIGLRGGYLARVLLVVADLAFVRCYVKMLELEIFCKNRDSPPSERGQISRNGENFLVPKFSRNIASTIL